MLEFYREFSAAIPDELTTGCGFLTHPEAGPVAVIICCYNGSIGYGAGAA
jgi:hypothetical protein